MQIAKNTVVSLMYELRTGGFESDIVEKTDNDNPLEFIYGVGMMMPKFEEYLYGKSANDEFRFVIPAKDGYGLVNKDYIITLPKAAFKLEGESEENVLVPGTVLPMQDDSGQHYHGMVVEVKDDSVVMDFNHPMAGSDLYFTGVINSVRMASPEEMDHGHVHGDGCDH